jgi:heme-degrading monooxygenase HmoA
LLVVVISVLRLNVRPGSEQALIRYYSEHEIFERARESGGFRGGRLLEPVEPETAFLVIAEWDDAEAYRRWLENPVRAELGRGLEPLVGSQPPDGAIYREAVTSASTRRSYESPSEEQ